MLQNDGERQVAPDVSGIRRDHVSRYRWAAQRIADAWLDDEAHPRKPGQRLRVLDAACGVGYGSRILHEAGFAVTGLDRSEEALAWAAQHFPGPTYILANLTQCWAPLGEFDASTCFETIEHLPAAAAQHWLRYLGGRCGRLYLSVPNETGLPWRPDMRWHFRHYTLGEITALLRECGWTVVAWGLQAGPESDVVSMDLEGLYLPETAPGRTLVLECVPCKPLGIEMPGAGAEPSTSEADMETPLAAMETAAAAAIAVCDVKITVRAKRNRPAVMVPERFGDDQELLFARGVKLIRVVFLNAKA